MIHASAAKREVKVATVTKERRWEEKRRVLRRGKRKQRKEKSEFT